MSKELKEGSPIEIDVGFGGWESFMEMVDGSEDTSHFTL